MYPERKYCYEDLPNTSHRLPYGKATIVAAIVFAAAFTAVDAYKAYEIPGAIYVIEQCEAEKTIIVWYQNIFVEDVGKKPTKTIRIIDGTAGQPGTAIAEYHTVGFLTGFAYRSTWRPYPGKYFKHLDGYWRVR